MTVLQTNRYYKCQGSSIIYINKILSHDTYVIDYYSIGTIKYRALSIRAYDIASFNPREATKWETKLVKKIYCL